MKRRPWYQQFQILAWVVAGLGALGTIIIVANRYIELPQKVEAADHKNALQDAAILELKKTNEIWQQIYQAQQPPPPPAPACQSAPDGSLWRWNTRQQEWEPCP